MCISLGHRHAHRPVASVSLIYNLKPKPEKKNVTQNKKNQVLVTTMFAYQHIRNSNQAEHSLLLVQKSISCVDRYLQHRGVMLLAWSKQSACTALMHSAKQTFLVNLSPNTTQYWN